MGDDNPVVKEFRQNFKQTIALSFKLFGSEIVNSPFTLQQMLTSPQVKAAIDNSILQFVQSRQVSSSSIVTVDELKSFALTAKKEVFGGGKKSYLEELKKTDEYNALMESIQPTTDSFKTTKVSVFYDENKGFLYYMLSIGVIGGFVALYQGDRSRELLTNGMNLLKDVPIVLPIGEIKEKDKKQSENQPVVNSNSEISGVEKKKEPKANLSLSLLEFKPDARLFGGKIGLNTKLKKVEIDVDFSLMVESAALKSYQSKAVFKFPVKKSKWQIDANFSNELSKNNMYLSFRMRKVGNQIEGTVGYIFENGNSNITGSMSYKPNNQTTWELNGTMNFKQKGMIDAGIFFKFIHKF